MSIQRIPPLVDITPSSARDWMIQMIDLRLMFHPDDDPADIISPPHWTRTFSDTEAVELRDIVDRLFKALGDEVYEIGCDVLGLNTLAETDCPT